MRYVSLALCPVANTAVSVYITYEFSFAEFPSFKVLSSSVLTASIPIILSFSASKIIFSALVENLTSPPNLIISSLMFSIISLNLSVPICGFCLYKISSLAPCLCSSLKTFLVRKSFIPVVSFPSEKVPAPPSPNCTFDSGFKVPSLQKFSTSLLLSSTFFPRSKTMGLYPDCARIRAANIPAGPNPTITGLSRDFLFLFTHLYSTDFACCKCNFSGKSKSKVYTSFISFLRLASIDSFTILRFVMSTFLESSIFSFLHIFSDNFSLLSNGVNVICSILYIWHYLPFYLCSKRFQGYIPHMDHPDLLLLPSNKVLCILTTPCSHN